MKRIKVMIFLLILAIFFSVYFIADRQSSDSDSNSLTAEMPDDFGFILTHSFIEVDTFNSTLKNTYAFDKGVPDAITDFAFSHEEMEKIYKAFVKYGIQDLPEEIDPDKGYMSIPPSFYKLLYISNGETKNISCETGARIDQKGISKDNNKFLKFIEEVWNYVYVSDAYKGLPSGPGME